MKPILITALFIQLVAGNAPAQTNTLSACDDSAAVGAPLTLGRGFGDHMVLQRDAPVKIFGTATPGGSVTVTFGAQQAAASADPKGRWLVTLPAMPANARPQSLSVTDGKETKFINDVLVGDVWLCSGQSNMKFKVRQSAGGKAPHEF